MSAPRSIEQQAEQTLLDRAASVITAALADLGGSDLATPDSVADDLREGNFHGPSGNCHVCPVARFLRATLYARLGEDATEIAVGVGADTTVVGMACSKLPYAEGTRRVTHPWAVARFIQRLDTRDWYTDLDTRPRGC